MNALPKLLVSIENINVKGSERITFSQEFSKETDEDFLNDFLKLSILTLIIV